MGESNKKKKKKEKKKRKKIEKEKELIPKRPKASQIKTRKRTKPQTLKKQSMIIPKQAIIKNIGKRVNVHKNEKNKATKFEMSPSPSPPAILLQKSNDSESIYDASPFLKSDDMMDRVPSPPAFNFDDNHKMDVVDDDDDNHSMMTTMTMAYKNRNPEDLIRPIGNKRNMQNPFMKRKVIQNDDHKQQADEDDDSEPFNLFKIPKKKGKDAK